MARVSQREVSTSKVVHYYNPGWPSGHVWLPLKGNEHMLINWSMRPNDGSAIMCCECAKKASHLRFTEWDNFPLMRGSPMCIKCMTDKVNTRYPRAVYEAEPMASDAPTTEVI